MEENNKQLIKYFGYGSNKDFEMMAHMVGNQNLKGEPGILQNYELCIQKLNQIRDKSPVSPRKIIRDGFGDNFELFVARVKPGAEIYGTIWDLTPLEIELVKYWEMVELGMQEEVNAMAVDSEGNNISVETQAVIDPPPLIDRVVTDHDYEPYIVLKEKMLSVADHVREVYFKQINN